MAFSNTEHRKSFRADFFFLRRTNNVFVAMNTKEKEKYIEEFNFPFCDESSKYEKVAKIGQGTFG